MKIIYEKINIDYEYWENEKELNTIILPGWLQNKRTYECLFNTIKNYSNIYVLEFPGFNISEEPKEIVNLDYYVRLLNFFIETLNINNVILFGHSFGGRVAIKYQAIYKKATYLILTAPAGIKEFNIQTKLKIFKYKVLKKYYRLFNKKKLNILYKTSGSKDYQGLSYNMKKTFTNIINENLTKYCKKITSPVLIIFGVNDQTVKLKTGIKMNKKIKTSTLIKINNAAHFPHLDNYYQYTLVLNEMYKAIWEDLT